MDVLQLCRAEDVREGEPVPVNKPSMPPLAVYKVGSDYFVTDNLCTHGNAMMTDGFQDGGIIECPFHGGAFEIATGAPAVFPCTIPLKTYAARVEGGWIVIDNPGEEKASA